MPYPAPQLFIDGRWSSPSSTARSVVRNPADNCLIGEVPHAGPAELDEAVAAAVRGFDAWRRISIDERTAILLKAAALIRDRVEYNARTLTLEQGKPLSEARAELLGSAAYFDYAAEEGKRVHHQTLAARPGSKRMAIRKEPIGVIAAFSPWNFPASLAARKVSTALAAGCSVVIKPAEETPGSFLGIARALDDAGLPKGVLNVVFGEPAAVSKRLIEAEAIRKIAFTGSTRVGKELAALAGAHAKPLVMELGGHAPVIICEDSDVEGAAALAVASKYRNAGQVCVSPTRFFVHERVYTRFVDTFVAIARNLVVGSGLDASTTMGPLANARRLEAVVHTVARARADGALCTLGGMRLEGNGFFFAPTVLEDVPDASRIMREEPFGPIAIMNRFANVDEAIARANATPYALAAYAFARSADSIAAISEGIDAGMVGINGFAIAYADTPTGGRRDSGYGSEGGREGFEAYLMTKTVNEQ